MYKSEFNAHIKVCVIHYVFLFLFLISTGTACIL
jgi:hypothetical protein